MRKVPFAQASGSLAKYAAELDDDIVVVTRGRRPLAALVPLKNVDRESIALSAHPEFLRMIARSRANFAAGRTLSLEEMRKAVLPTRAAHRRSRPGAKGRRD